MNDLLDKMSDQNYMQNELDKMRYEFALEEIVKMIKYLDDDSNYRYHEELNDVIDMLNRISNNL